MWILIYRCMFYITVLSWHVTSGQLLNQSDILLPTDSEIGKSFLGNDSINDFIGESKSRSNQQLITTQLTDKSRLQDNVQNSCAPEGKRRLVKYGCRIYCSDTENGDDCEPHNCSTMISSCVSEYNGDLNNFVRKVVPKAMDVIQLDISNRSITILPDYVFAGLSELLVLHLNSNKIRVLPHRVFNGLDNLRYLNLSSNYIENISHDIFYGLSNLAYLSLYHNKIKRLPHDIFHNSSALLFLDLKSNTIAYLPLGIFKELSKFEILILSNNMIQVLPNKLFQGLHDLRQIDLAYNYMTEIPLDMFKGLNNLTVLLLNNNNISSLSDNVFQVIDSTVSSTKQLKLDILDVSYNQLTHLPTLPSTLLWLNIVGNKMIVKERMFERLENLEILFTNTPFMCCVKPPSVSDSNCIHTQFSVWKCYYQNCKSEVDVISSCSALIGSTVLRVCLWMIGTSAFIGNLVVIVYRLSLDRENMKKNYSLFTLNLAISDLLMAIYLLIIGVIDVYYNGVYAWNDQEWRNSILCTIAGVMSSVSSEMSTFLILLVTIDRLIVVMFPLSRLSRGNISWRLAVTGSVVLWIVAITVIPIVVMQSYFNGEFYSQSGMCLALPLTEVERAGTEYSFGVFVCLNSFLFAVIFLGQICICKSLRKSGRNITSSQNRQRERSVSTTLFFVVMTDFCCWFPIGVMGLISRYGIQIPDEVYAWVMVFVLPINAAINPFLYTASAVWFFEPESTSPLHYGWFWSGLPY